MITKRIAGELEIDTDRGVIYFHSPEKGTMLRICRLDIPPNVQFIDITHMIGMQVTVKDAV
jgi:hypothetical protein